MPYRDLSNGQILVAAGGFATICGWLSYLLKVQEGKAFLWREFFLHGAIIFFLHGAIINRLSK